MELTKNDLIQLEQLHNSHLGQIKKSNFDVQEFILYQEILTNYIMQFYDDNNFQAFSKNPKLFIKTKTKTEIVNAIFIKYCFNIIDLLSVYITTMDSVRITCPAALANTILMELVWNQQALTAELNVYL